MEGLEAIEADVTRLGVLKKENAEEEVNVETLKGNPEGVKTEGLERKVFAKLGRLRILKA
ncbi:hypothetical protein Pyn_24423 [Prunus yedoensis var. nudiflora]|uniref:Uncharacterized protein n=1 Tax=Prunus yedoensis var. nudiflora TaxID=2094558 RepID=A0A314XLV6_PRUYE|nr:hypothetical protein Pyn_24423 [Prunus yedoensis var. nudiflora]